MTGKPPSGNVWAEVKARLVAEITDRLAHLPVPQGWSISNIVEEASQIVKQANQIAQTQNPAPGSGQTGCNSSFDSVYKSVKKATVKIMRNRIDWTAVQERLEAIIAGYTEGKQTGLWHEEVVAEPATQQAKEEWHWETEAGVDVGSPVPLLGETLALRKAANIMADKISWSSFKDALEDFVRTKLAGRVALSIPGIVQSDLEEAANKWHPLGEEAISSAPFYGIQLNLDQPGVLFACKMVLEEIARALPWDDIFNILKSFLLRGGYSSSDADDIAQQVIGKAWEIWNPGKETNWELPGMGIALRILAWEVARWNREEARRKELLRAWQPPTPQDFISQLIVRDEAEVIYQAIDEWRQNVITRKQAAAFTARYVKEMTVVEVGALLHPDPDASEAACRAKWNRMDTSLLMSLAAYLASKGLLDVP